jgi:hypothetical protein
MTSSPVDYYKILEVIGFLQRVTLRFRRGIMHTI